MGLNHEKNWRSKISWHTPFKELFKGKWRKKFKEIYLCFFWSFFVSGVGFSLTLRFTTLFHNDPAAHQDHCGRCRIRTPNLCPRSQVRILLSWRIIKNYAKFFLFPFKTSKFKSTLWKIKILNFIGTFSILFNLSYLLLDLTFFKRIISGSGSVDKNVGSLRLQANP